MTTQLLKNYQDMQRGRKKKEKKNQTARYLMTPRKELTKHEDTMTVKHRIKKKEEEENNLSAHRCNSEF